MGSKHSQKAHSKLTAQYSTAQHTTHHRHVRRDAVEGERGAEPGPAVGAHRAVPAEVVQQVHAPERVAARQRGLPQVGKVREQGLVGEEVQGVLLHRAHRDRALVVVIGYADGDGQLLVPGGRQPHLALLAAVHALPWGGGQDGSSGRGSSDWL